MADNSEETTTVDETPPNTDTDGETDSLPDEEIEAAEGPRQSEISNQIIDLESEREEDKIEAPASMDVDWTETEQPAEEQTEKPAEGVEQPTEEQKEQSEEQKGQSEEQKGQPAEEYKPPVKQKLSIDETDQIKSDVVTDKIDLDDVMEFIQDPDIVSQAENIFGLPRGDLGPAIYLSPTGSSIEEEEERTSEIISYLAEFGLQPVKEPIDRQAYEEEFQTLKTVGINIRRKNGLLHRKIGEYYKKRKMLRVFEDVSLDLYESVLDKYEQKIMDLHKFIEKINREKLAINNELSDMRTLRDEQKAELNRSITEMQDREREIGHGLIDSRTGKAISDKVIDRFISRQKQKSNEIAVIRLDYIKRRDKVKEIDNRIKSLETIDGTLHLMDFEQLRMENQTFTDKIEERDEELMRLRGRYSHAMQAIGHIREKNNIIQNQIDNLHDKKICEETTVNQIREELNTLKLQRDSNRDQRAKLKCSSGILTYPKLLLDMEIEMNQIENLRTQLENLKLKNKDVRQKLGNIRITIEKTGHLHEKRFKKAKTGTGKRRYLFSRPTLSYPLQSKIALLKSNISEIE